MSYQASPSPHINMEFLRKEAKALLRQCRSHDRAALARIRAGLPRLSTIEIKLADVQFALAREHGYANWAHLKRSQNRSEETVDFSKPGSSGTLPAEHVPWGWGVTYTVRPELLSDLDCGQEYRLTASVLWKRPHDETFGGYADLYDRASAIAQARAAELRCAHGGSLHTRILGHTWFRHGSTSLVRAAVVLGVACLKDRPTKPLGEKKPDAEALAVPGGMKPGDASAHWKLWHEIYNVVDVRDSSAARGIWGFSYGEFVPTCDGLNYEPYVERAEKMARFHLPFLESESRSGKDELNIARREWFCVTKPDIAVVHLFAQV
jgi:hypothetical protein